MPDLSAPPSTLSSAAASPATTPLPASISTSSNPPVSQTPPTTMARGVISAAMCKQRLRLSDEDYRPFRKQCATIARSLGIKFKRLCPQETWEIYTKRAMESEYLNGVREVLGEKRTAENKAQYDALDWILINVLLSAQVEAKRKGEPGGYGSRRSSAVGGEGGMAMGRGGSAELSTPLSVHHAPHAYTAGSPAEKRPRISSTDTSTDADPHTHHSHHQEQHNHLLNELLKQLNDGFPESVPPLSRLQLQQQYLQIAEAIQHSGGDEALVPVLEAVMKFGLAAMNAGVEQ